MEFLDPEDEDEGEDEKFVRLGYLVPGPISAA